MAWGILEVQTIQINSHKISYVLYQHNLLTVVLQTGERFLFRNVEENTFSQFIHSEDKDKFYKTEIEANKKFKRIQLFI
nr:KTSC domain-containing protein [Acinetobacter indicus]